MNNKLVLFDIDGTLITAGGAGTRSLDRAFLGLFGIHEAFKEIKMAGKTDIQIIREGLCSHGLSDTNGTVEKITENYVDILKEEIQNPWRKAKPGVHEMLKMLHNNNIHLGLLTGNIEKGARIKLGPFELNKYFPTGAFGSDHEDRDMLLPVAVRRFSEFGINVPPERCIVIGDTPRDVQCSKIHGAFCIAVATGSYSKEKLKEKGADLVVETLGEINDCMGFIDKV